MICGMTDFTGSTDSKSLYFAIDNKAPSTNVCKQGPEGKACPSEYNLRAVGGRARLAMRAAPSRARCEALRSFSAGSC